MTWLDELSQPSFEGIFSGLESDLYSLSKETLLQLMWLCEQDEPQYSVVLDRVPDVVLTLLGLQRRDFAVDMARLQPGRMMIPRPR